MYNLLLACSSSKRTENSQKIAHINHKIQKEHMKYFGIILMVNVLDSGSNGLGSAPGPRPQAEVTVLCSCARHFTLIMPLSTRSKCVPANCEGNLTKNAGLPVIVMEQHPIQGGNRSLTSLFMLWKPDFNLTLYHRNLGSDKQPLSIRAQIISGYWTGFWNKTKLQK